MSHTLGNLCFEQKLNFYKEYMAFVYVFLPTSSSAVLIDDFLANSIDES